MIPNKNVKPSANHSGIDVFSSTQNVSQDKNTPNHETKLNKFQRFKIIQYFPQQLKKKVVMKET